MFYNYTLIHFGAGDGICKDGQDVCPARLSVYTSETSLSIFAHRSERRILLPWVEFSQDIVVGWTLGSKALCALWSFINLTAIDCSIQRNNFLGPCLHSQTFLLSLNNQQDTHLMCAFYSPLSETTSNLQRNVNIPKKTYSNYIYISMTIFYIGEI